MFSFSLAHPNIDSSSSLLHEVLGSASSHEIATQSTNIYIFAAVRTSHLMSTKMHYINWYYSVLLQFIIPVLIFINQYTQRDKLTIFIHLLLQIISGKFFHHQLAFYLKLETYTRLLY